eukprot:TRINITY_DN9962_c0_g1_i1.p1 TRINITY_DN9962_c0_g1~~TRINITY_DN9962_c0_g1_i1.p1  ORF type:complete len:334 (-),score=38.42 TRINITY_DN9962_c0_g1_i1:213-1214(-)
MRVKKNTLLLSVASIGIIWIIFQILVLDSKPDELQEQRKELSTYSDLFFILTKITDNTWDDIQFLCSVESTCRIHPKKSTVIYHLDELATDPHDKPLWANVLTKCSVSFVRLWLDEEISQVDEEIADWWKNNRKDMQYNHVSDIARLALLYKHGGVYLDTDFVPIRSLMELHNTLGYQGASLRYLGENSGKELNGAVMIFDKHNEYIRQCLKALMSAWGQRLNDDAVWSSLGPKLLTQVYDQHKFSELVVKPVGVQYFYPMHYTETSFLSEWPASRKSMQLKQVLNSTSYGIHLWHAKTKEMDPNPKTLYGDLLKTYCPVTYPQWTKLYGKKE